MKTTKWADIKRKRFSDAQIRKMDESAAQKLLELNLADLRRRLGLTQEELAEAVDATQATLSRIEHRSDHLVSTLREYVRGLGGELEVTAVVRGERVRLHV